MIAENIFSPRQYNWLQLAANVIFILIWFLANEGLLFWDDFSYLNYAHQINEGVFQITSNHFTSRTGLIYPAAWLINLLGVNEFSVAAFPLICALGIINLVFLLGRRVNYWIGILGGLMLVCDYHMINFAIHLFPEMPLAFCVFGFFCAYYLMLKGEVDYRTAGLICALSLFIALLIKTTVFLLIPLVLFLLVNDRLQKRNRGFWIVFIVLGLFAFSIQGLWYLEAKGSFFFRFQNIADNHVATSKTFFDKSGLLWKRLTYLPLLTFAKGGFFIPLLAALPSIFALRKRSFSIKNPEHLWPVASLILIATYWFFSTNWRYYSPLPLETRHIMFFIPILIMSAVSYWPNHKWFNIIGKRPIWIALILGFLVIPAYAISHKNRRGFKQEKAIIEQYFVNDENEQTIITDGLTSYGFPFFYRFKEMEDKYIWFPEVNDMEIREGNFLLINENYFNKEFLGINHYEQVKSDEVKAKAEEKGLKLVTIYSEGKVKLFQFQ